MARQKNKKIDQLSKIVLPVLKSYDVKRAAIFGSFARGTATKTSDIDLLVEFSTTKSLLDVVELKRILEKKTKKPVDISTFAGLEHRFKQRIANDIVPIL